MATSQLPDSWQPYKGKGMYGNIFKGKFLKICDVNAAYETIPDSQAWIPFDEYLHIHMQERKGDPVAIDFTDLCHETSYSAAYNILSQSCMKPGTDEFSWWRIVTPPNAAATVQQRFIHLLKNPAEQKNQFGTSDAFNFNSPSIYGNFRQVTQGYFFKLEFQDFNLNICDS